MRHVTCMFSFLLTVVHCMWRVMSRCPPCTSCGESCARVHRARHVDPHAMSTPMEAWKGPCLNMKTHVHRPKHRSACQHDKLHDNMSGRMSTQCRTACGDTCHQFILRGMTYFFSLISFVWCVMSHLLSELNEIQSFLTAQKNTLGKHFSEVRDAQAKGLVGTLCLCFSHVMSRMHVLGFCLWEDRLCFK